jgi:CHASE1-domain containing sensor protein
MLRWAKKNRAAALSMGLIFCAGLLCTMLVHQLNSRNLRNKSLTALEAVAREQLVMIGKQLESQLDLVRAVGIYVSEHEDFSPEHFQEFCEPLIRSHPSIKALSWAAVVPDDKRQAFEATARFSGDIRRSIYERDGDGSLVPAAKRPYYFPVQGIVPLETNTQAIGFDLGSEPMRRATLQKAQQFDTPVITGPLQLVQDEEPVEAFLAIVPVWNDQANSKLPRASAVDSGAAANDPKPARGPSQTVHWPKGFASGVFHTADVIDPCLKLTRQQIWLRIVDVTDQPTLVYEVPELQQAAFRGDPLPLTPEVTSAERFGRSWRVEFYLPSHARLEDESTGLLIAIIGFLLSTVLSGVPFLINLFKRS